jgi:hypothetical protein
MAGGNRHEMSLKPVIAENALVTTAGDWRSRSTKARSDAAASGVIAPDATATSRSFCCT